MVAAHHARQALRVLEIYSDQIGSTSSESSDLSVAHCYINGWLWLHARLQLAQALCAMPSPGDRPTKEDDELCSVSAQCKDGLEEADSMSAGIFAAQFRLLLAADRMKSGSLDAVNESHKLMHVSIFYAPETVVSIRIRNETPAPCSNLGDPVAGYNLLQNMFFKYLVDQEIYIDGN